MELKPCPFCGSKPYIFPESTDAIALMPKVTFYKVGCAKCQIYAIRQDLNDALNAWNRRANDV